MVDNIVPFSSSMEKNPDFPKEFSPSLEMPGKYGFSADARLEADRP